MRSKNSLFDFVDVIRSIKLSAASITFIGDIARLRKEVFSKIFGSTRSSSFLVPEEAKLIAGQRRSSAIFRSSIISLFPVPLNYWKISSSIFEPVSTSAVATIVSDPASSELRAEEKICLGFSRARTSNPPVMVRPLFPEAAL